MINVNEYIFPVVYLKAIPLTGQNDRPTEILLRQMVFLTGNLEMFEQILSSGNIRNIWRTVWRTWILILELKGLKLIYPWISTYLSLSRLCNLRYFRRFFIDYASRYNVRKREKSHHCVISEEVLSKGMVIRTTPLCNTICSTCCAFSRPK